jgi:CHAT domain-containing protein/tetratricopeptide (TPR) repeat protein
MRFTRYSLHSLILLAIVVTLPARLLDKTPASLADSFPGGSNSSQPGSTALELPKVGQWTTPELAPGELHSYRFFLNAGDHLHLIIEQQGMNIEPTLYGPDGSILINSVCADYQPTPFSWIAKASGAYRIEVRSLENRQSKGRYGLKVETIRPLISTDEPRIVAEQAIAAGMKLLTQWREDSVKAALDKFTISLVSWREGEDARGEADALKRIGDVYRSLGQFEKAQTSYQSALGINNRLGDRRAENRDLNALCSTSLLLGANQKALKYAERALEISKAVQDQWGEAEALNNLGEVYNWLGQIQKAFELYYKALAIWTTLGDRRGAAQTYMYLGFTYSDLGQPTKASESFEKALPLWESQDDRIGKGNALGAIARLYSRLGESQLALDHFNKARDLMQGIGDPISNARVLSGIAYVYDGLGNKTLALEYYGRALALYQGVKYLNGVKVTLFDMGNLYHSVGDYQRALDCYSQDLALSKTVGDRREQAFALRGIGLVHNSLGSKTQALDNLRRALIFYQAEKDLRGEADTLNLIGAAHEETTQAGQALTYYNRALPIYQRAGDRAGEASALYNIAQAERAANHLPEAQTRIEAALQVIESLRRKVTSQDSRASYFATIRQYYELHVDILMSLEKRRPKEGFAEVAFDTSEKARARSFLESLKEAHIDFRTDVDAAQLERERSLQQALNEKGEEHARILAKSTSDREAEAVAKEIDQLTLEYNELKAQIKTQSPRYAGLSQQQPLSSAEVQTRLLDDNTLLLEYMLGDQRSYVWAVSPREISSYELPGRAEIEKAAREVHTSLIANQPLPDETFEQRQARVVTADEQLPSQIANLSKILIDPVAAKLGTKRLLIVADGTLQYIPFQILTKPSDPNRTGSEISATAAEARPLMVDHEIVNEPSASALALLIGDTTTRKQPSNSVAVFADPVFEVDDPRIKSSSSIKPEVMTSELRESELHRALRDVGVTGNGARIPRLPASRDEADAIMAAAPWWSGFRAMGFEANRAAAMKSELGNYKIVHFATHSFLNDEHPELSGVVLSLFDEKGQAQDGFLRLHDIYNLKLPVDLVVLSACNTGLGKDVKGEGLIGLTRGFMYAGASSVVASLWKVDDDATAELMRLFYGYMLRDGLSPAAALRKAQVTMSQQKRWRSPYFWAGFVIQGQYLGKEQTSRFPVAQLAVCLFGAAVVSAAAFYALKRRRKRIL